MFFLLEQEQTVCSSTKPNAGEKIRKGEKYRYVAI